MNEKEELLKQLLQEYMNEKGCQGDIQLGQFTIKQATISSNKSLITPNNFVLDCFQQYNNTLGSLDNFIENPPSASLDNLKSNSTGSNQSVIVPPLEMKNKRQKNINKQVFPKVFQVLDSFNQNLLKNQIEDALQDDIEQVLDRHISVCESSNTPLSFDTLTTETISYDPLRAFLLSLLPNQQLLTQPIFYPKQQIDFLYIYSQPLVHIHQQQKKVIALVETQKEKDAIIDVLNSEGAELKFQAIPARVDNFGESLDLAPLILHYSGHGIHIDQQSYLLFEGHTGMASLISTQNLEILLSKLQRKLLFVFVASCHSRFIGDVFKAAGADHVICVNTKEKIMDEVCRVFARAFYHAIIRGQSTICDAFQIAKNQIKVEGRFPNSEENKFIILTKDVPIFQEHLCQKLKLSQGQFKDLTRRPKYSDSLPAPVPHFFGRQLLMQEIIEKIIINRFVLIKGILGIGKSAILKEVSNYISERQIFKDGTLFFQLGECDSLDGLCSILFQKLIQNQPTIQSKQEMKQLMITQLIQGLKSLEVLIILDNCDQLMHSIDREPFEDFLEIVLSNCSKVHLAIGCRCEIGVVGSPGKVIRVEGLLPEDSVELLISYAQREITRTEIEELLAQKLDDFHSNKIIMLKFANHQLISMLNGHPQAIILTAGLLENYTLKELYNQLIQKQVFDIPMNESFITYEEQKTLRLSLDISWRNLVDRNEKSAQFWTFLSMLPSGACRETFETVWGNTWEKYKNQLLKSSLIIQIKKTLRVFFSLHPFMMKFAESKLEEKAKKQFHTKLTRYYIKKLQSMYQSIGTQLLDTGNLIEEFLCIEANIKAVVLREIHLTGQIDVDVSSSQDTKLIKKQSEQTEDDDDTSEFTLPLTKENLEIVQKRYESTNKRNHSKVQNYLTNSVYSTQTFKHFDQTSDEPLFSIVKSSVTDQAFRRKSISNYQTQPAISEVNELSDQFEIDAIESQNYVANPQTDEMGEIISPIQLPLNIDNKILVVDPAQPVLKKSNMIENNFKSNPIKEQKKLKFEDEVEQDKALKDQIIPLKKKEKSEKSVTNTIRQIQTPPKQRNKTGQQQFIRTTKTRNSEDKSSDQKQELRKQQRQRIQKLVYLYSSVLLLLRRYKECQKLIQWTYKYLVDDNDLLVKANLTKLKACVYYMEKDFMKAKQYFKQAEEFFIKKGCMLGVGACEAAIGYLYLQDREFNQAKVCFENALYFYEQINHEFGRHFLNRWLLLVKGKISSLKNDRSRHVKEEKQLIECLRQETKRGIKIDTLIHKKHKAGIFVLRGLGDNISIFFEQAWVSDSKQKSIINFLKNPIQNPLAKKKDSNVIFVMDFDQNQDTSTQQDNLTIQKLYYSSSSSASSLKKQQLRKNKTLDNTSTKQQLNQIAEEEDKLSENESIVNNKKLSQLKKDTYSIKLDTSIQESKKLRNSKTQKIMPCFKKSKKNIQQ